MTDALVLRTEQHDYAKLFIQDLNWNRPDHSPVTYAEDGRVLTAVNVSSYKGIRVWVCDQNPGAKLEAALDRAIAKTTTDRLLIFHDDTEQVWRWPVRSRNHTITVRPARHRHRAGTVDPPFAQKLEAIRLPIDTALDTNTVLGRVRAAFDVEAHNETKQASKLMARMYAAMEKAYPAGFDSKTRDHQISVTLARVLFLMFGDDTDMWTADLFRDFVHHHTASDGSDIGARLTRLFDYLDTREDERAAVPEEHKGFRYVNGGIFHEKFSLPDLNAEFRAVTLEASERDWSKISPAIFGSMFQSVRDAKTRRELGEHYTSEGNILKTLNPLLLDELRADLESALSRDTRQKKVNALRTLWNKLGEIRFMDPACGCGNFIIVAYRELRAIELQIMEALVDLEQTDGQATLGGNLARMIKVTLDHFFGIEIDEWPAKIAQTAMFMIDRQCDLRLRDRFGDAPDRLPIRTEAKITVGNALRINWSDMLPPSQNVVIAGNPPFFGKKERSTEQTRDMQAVWGKDYSGEADYVTSWFAKARDYFGSIPGQWAFVATNSISQGVAVAPVFGALARDGWTFKFAHRPFVWTSEAKGKAVVHVVIVGMRNAPVGTPRLFDYKTSTAQPEEISARFNAYLVDGPDVFVRERRTALSPQLASNIRFGSMAADGKGGLLVDPKTYHTLASTDPIAIRHLRPFVGARELIHSIPRWCIWMPTPNWADIHASPFLTERIEWVRRFRAEEASDPGVQEAAAHPYRFNRVQQPAEEYLCIPRHISEDRLWMTAARLGPDVISGDANFVVDDPDGFFFSVVSSNMFMVWQRTVGGRIKSDLRFASTVTWNTFPLVPLDSSVRQAVIDAGRAVIAARSRQSEQSLASMYRPENMEKDLVDAHLALDEIIDSAFGVRPNDTLLRKQEVLFARYQELTAPLLAAVSQRGQGRRRPRR